VVSLRETCVPECVTFLVNGSGKWAYYCLRLCCLETSSDRLCWKQIKGTYCKKYKSILYKGIVWWKENGDVRGHEPCNFTHSKLEWCFKLCAWVCLFTQYFLCTYLKIRNGLCYSKAKDFISSDTFLLVVVSREYAWSGDQTSYDAQCVVTPPHSCVRGYLSLSTACRGSTLGACQCQIFSIGELFCRCLTKVIVEPSKSVQPVFMWTKQKWCRLWENLCSL